MENIYGYYKKCIEDDVDNGTSFGGYDDIVYRVNSRKKIVDYAKRAPYEGNVVEIGQYDYKNAKYAIDMEYLKSLDEDKRENYIKYSFLRHYLYLGRLYEKKEDFKASVKNVEEFLKVKPFFNIEVPREFYAGTGWPIEGDYSDMIKDDDYIDTKKFLEKNDDTILICVMDDPNPDYPDYYDPEPDVVYPISRSYLKKIYNSLNESETYVGNFTSFAYRCAKDIEGFDSLFNITGNQLYLLSPYFIITGASQEIYINARDAMSMMYSNDKVFALRKEKDIPISAGVNVLNVRGDNPFGDAIDVISADHCQGGTNKTIYRVLTAEIDEYTEVEKQVERVEALTKEQLFERYPKFKDILEKPQRCKTAATLSKVDLFLEKMQNEIIANDNDQIIKEIDIVYERYAKLNKLKQLNMDYKATLRAQQEIQNITVYQEQIGEVKNKCKSLLLDAMEKHPEVKQILENVVREFKILDKKEEKKYYYELIELEYYQLFNYVNDYGMTLDDRELKTEADKQIEKSQKILKIKEIKDISPSQVNVLVDYISSHDFNAKHKLETVEEKMKQELYSIIEYYLDVKERAKRLKQESEDDDEEYITDKQYEAAMQSKITKEDLRKLAEGPYIPFKKYYDKVEKYIKDNLDPVLIDDKNDQTIFIFLEDFESDILGIFKKYDYKFEYEYDKYVINYITNVIFEYSRSDIYASKEEKLRNVDYYVYTIIKQVTKTYNSFEQVIKTFLDPDELKKVYFRYNVMVEYTDLDVIEKLLTYGGKAYLALSAIIENIDTEYNEVELYEELVVVIQQNEDADNEVLLKKIQETVNKVVGEEVEIPEEELEYIDEEVLGIKFVIEIYEPEEQESMDGMDQRLLDSGFGMTLLRRFHRAIRAHYIQYAIDDDDVEFPALSDYYHNTTIDGIIDDLKVNYGLEKEEELSEKLEDIKFLYDTSVINHEDFMSTIQQHYNSYEGPIEIDEYIFGESVSIEDVLNALESTYGDLTEYNILKQQLENLQAEMDEDMEEDEEENNEPLARRLNFDDEEDLAGAMENLNVGDDDNLDEIVEELYSMFDNIHGDADDDDIEMITKDEIKAKFLEYFNTIADPNYITSEFINLIKSKYENHWYDLSEEDRQTYRDELYDDIASYNKLAQQVDVLEP